MIRVEVTLTLTPILTKPSLAILWSSCVHFYTRLDPSSAPKHALTEADRSEMSSKWFDAQQLPKVNIN